MAPYVVIPQRPGNTLAERSPLALAREERCSHFSATRRRCRRPGKPAAVFCYTPTTKVPAQVELDGV